MHTTQQASSLPQDRLSESLQVLLDEGRTTEARDLLRSSRLDDLRDPDEHRTLGGRPKLSATWGWRSSNTT